MGTSGLINSEPPRRKDVRGRPWRGRREVLNGVWSENWICMSLRRFQPPVVAIMGFEAPESFRPIPLSANRRFRVDEPMATADH